MNNESLEQPSPLKEVPSVTSDNATTPPYPLSPPGEGLLAILSNHCGEAGTSEGAVETLQRIIADRDALNRQVLALKNLVELESNMVEDITRQLDEAQEQLRLANIDACNTEAERNDLTRKLAEANEHVTRLQEVNASLHNVTIRIRTEQRDNAIQQCRNYCDEINALETHLATLQAELDAAQKRWHYAATCDADLDMADQCIALQAQLEHYKRWCKETPSATLWKDHDALQAELEGVRRDYDAAQHLADATGNEWQLCKQQLAAREGQVKELVEGLTGCFNAILETYPQKREFMKQLESGELARRLIHLGPGVFDPNGTVRACIQAKSLLTKPSA